MSNASGTLTISLKGNAGNLISGLNNGSRSINSFANNAESKFKKLKSVMDGVANTAFNKFTALGSAWLGGSAVNDIAKFESSLARLGIQAGKTPAQMAGVRQEIFRLGKMRGISKEDALAGITAMVDRTGDLQGAVDTFESLTLASQASGSSMESLGVLATNLGSKMNLSSNQMTDALATLLEQGKAGEFQLKDLADQGERLFSAGAGFNMTGMKGVSQLGGIMQVIRAGTGSTEMATTAFESLTRDLISKKGKIKGTLGVDIIDPVASKKAGKEVFRDLGAIMQEMILKSKGQKGLLMQAGIGDESVRAFSSMIAEYDRVGAKSFEANNKLKMFMNTTGNVSNLQKDASIYSETFANKLERLKTTWDELANNTLAKPGGVMDKIGDAMKWASENADTLNTGLKVTLGLMAGLAVLKAGSMIMEGIGSVKDIFGGGKGGKGGLGGAMGGATPVYVVNMGAGGMGGGLPGMGGAGGLGGASSGPSKMGAWFKRTMPTFSRWGSSIGNLFSPLSKMGTKLGGLGTKLGGLAVAFGPLIGVVASLAFTGTMLYTLWGAISDYKSSMENATKTIQETKKMADDALTRRYGNATRADELTARSMALGNQASKAKTPEEKRRLEIEQTKTRMELAQMSLEQNKRRLAGGNLTGAEKSTAEAEMKTTLLALAKFAEEVKNKENAVNINMNVNGGQVTAEADRGSKVTLNKKPEQRGYK